MDVLTDLERERKSILSRISDAAGRGRSDVVVRESERLKRVETLIKRQRQIVSQLEKLQRTQESPSATPREKRKLYIRKPFQKVDERVSPRQNAAAVRKAFLANLERTGIRLVPIEGQTIYRTVSGKRVGIAVATERQPDKWFLGLRSGAFQHAVLLCQSDNGQIEEILLPASFFSSYGRSISQSGGQMKFNVVRRGGVMYVQVPYTGDVNISGYSQNYDCLK